MVDLAQNTNYLTKLLRNLCPLLENNSFFLGCLNPAPGFSTFTIRGQLKPGINLGAEVPFWDDPMVALGLAFSSLPEFRLGATETRTGIALAFVLQYHFGTIQWWLLASPLALCRSSVYGQPKRGLASL